MSACVFLCAGRASSVEGGSRCSGRPCLACRCIGGSPPVREWGPHNDRMLWNRPKDGGGGGSVWRLE